MRIPKSVAIIIISVILSINLGAVEIDIAFARRVAKNFFSEKSGIPVNELEYGEEFKLKYLGNTCGYVFNINAGYIIVSGNDAVFPVLAYSFESGYSGKDFPQAFNFWMENYQSQIIIAGDESRKSGKVIQKIWLRYAQENFYPKEILSWVQPLIHTTWDQGCFYNSWLPEEPNGPCGHLWTGCVATALGQIMKFYNYPKQGTGTYGYNSSYGWVEADFGNTEYNWVGMNYHLTEENNPTAEFLYHSAVSIHSQFFSSGTGAYDFEARDALVEFFDYSADAQFYWRDSYPGDWKALLRSELDQDRPVLYGGVDSETSAGHTLVCDGYQDSSFFHFNWGWNGAYNGYFYLDSLIAGNYFFDFQHDAVIGIKPDITGIIEIYPPENLTVSYNSGIVNLSWTAPSIQGNLERIGYNVFRNDKIINSQILTDTFFSDPNALVGWQQYKASAVYIGSEKIPEEFTEVFVEGNSISQTELSAIKIYPNPVSDFIIISTNNLNANKLSVSITDLKGNKIWESEYFITDSNDITVIKPGDIKGLFIITLKTGSLFYSKKMLIL